MKGECEKCEWKSVRGDCEGGECEGESVRGRVRERV